MFTLKRRQVSITEATAATFGPASSLPMWSQFLRPTHCYPEDGVKTAPAPTKIIPKSKLSDQFIIDALIKKFDEHLPA